MGAGMKLECPECGYEECVPLGIGMGFPGEYRRTVKRIREGKYGEEWKNLLESVPGAAINAEEELYVCSSCGHFQMEEVLSVYQPKEEQSSLDSSADKDQKINYVLPEELPGRYKLVKAYVHRCKKCGKRMKRYAEGDQLKCPECRMGSMMQTERYMWD